jgi:hypothetical protein
VAHTNEVIVQQPRPRDASAQNEALQSGPAVEPALPPTCPLRDGSAGPDELSPVEQAVNSAT